MRTNRTRLIQLLILLSKELNIKAGKFAPPREASNEVLEHVIVSITREFVEHGRYASFSASPEVLTKHNIDRLHEDMKHLEKVQYPIPSEFFARLKRWTNFEHTDARAIRQFLRECSRIKALVDMTILNATRPPGALYHNPAVHPLAVEFCETMGIDLRKDYWK